MATLLSQEWVHWSIGLRVSRHAQKQRKRRKWLGFSFGQRKNEGSRVGARVLVHRSVVVYKRSPTALKIKNNNVRNFSRDSQSMMWPCVISVFLRSSRQHPLLADADLGAHPFHLVAWTTLSRPKCNHISIHWIHLVRLSEFHPKDIDYRSWPASLRRPLCALDSVDAKHHQHEGEVFSHVTSGGKTTFDKLYPTNAP